MAPSQSPVFAALVAPRQVLSFAAIGEVNNNPGIPLFGPAGNWASPVVSHRAGAENGISDILAPLNSLLGVFLDDGQPDATPAPSRLDFSSLATRDYATLAPALKQVFFIGSGFTASGGLHKITVPASATRLFLGTMDAYEWNNNVGTFSVGFVPPDTTPPTTTASASPAPNANGWNNTDVTVTLSATDDLGGSGVQLIAYSLTGAQSGGGGGARQYGFHPDLG